MQEMNVFTEILVGEDSAHELGLADAIRLRNQFVSADNDIHS